MNSLDKWGKVNGERLASHMQGGLIDQLLNVAVERPALNKLKVEVGRIVKDRLLSGLTSDYGENRHLNPVNKASGHQGPVHRQAAVGAQWHLGRFLKLGDDFDSITAHKSRVWPVKGVFQCCRHYRCGQVLKF